MQNEHLKAFLIIHFCTIALLPIGVNEHLLNYLQPGKSATFVKTRCSLLT